jgi:hypothetical protein
MGNKIKKQVLMAQETPIVGIDSRFCLHTKIKVILLSPKIFSPSAHIREASTGRSFFMVKFGGPFWKTLLDVYGNKVCSITAKFQTCSIFGPVVGGDASSHLMDITRRNGFSEQMEVSLNNQYNGQPIMMGLKADMFLKRGYIWVDHGATGDKSNRQCVAKIVRPFTIEFFMFKNAKYYLEVAPGVDVALMTAFCHCLFSAYI